VKPRPISPRSRVKADEAQRARSASDLLARAGQELATSLDYQATLRNVTNLVVPAVADDCFILLKNQRGEPELVAGAHIDPERGALVRVMIERLNETRHRRMPLFVVLATGSPMLIHDPVMKLEGAPRPDEELLQLALKLGIRSRIVVPLKARGEIIGVMTWLSTDAKRLYDNEDLKLAEDVAQRAAYAIDNARLHEAEKLANQRLNDLLNGLQASVWEGRGRPPNVELTFMNRAAEHMFGYTAEQLNDPEFTRSIIFPADYPRLIAQYEESVRTRRDFEVEYRVRRSDGQIIWIRDMARVTPRPDGTIVRTVSSDITKHRQAEERLRILAEASRSLDASLDYETTLSNVTGVIVPALADDCIIFLENDTGKLELVSSAHSDPARVEVAREFFRHYPVHERSDQPLQMVHRTGESVLIQDAITPIDSAVALSREQYESSIGTRVQAGLAVPLRSRGHILGVMVWATVESGRHYEREDLNLAEEIGNRAGIAVDNARLFKASQDAVAARDRFLAMLGHELRNPLNSISIVARMLERESLSDERLAKLRTLIGRETRQLSTVVNDLLDVSRMLAGKMSLELQTLDLGALVRESTQSFEETARLRELILTVSIPEQPLSIVGDPVRLHQLIANLLTNAIKFTEPSGRVEIMVRAVADQALLSVRDTGIGIAPEMLGRIFEPFAQAALQPPHGLGLGLSLVKEVTELHGGTVTASSEGIGRGAEFTIYLPLATAH
jgi:PAS domain S-box-containing protein